MRAGRSRFRNGLLELTPFVDANSMIVANAAGELNPSAYRFPLHGSSLHRLWQA